MTWLSNQVVAHLRDVAAWPDLAGDRYTVLGPIGRGGMGTVYAARDELLGREVALKVSNAPASGSGLDERLRREARVLATLDHPGIAPVHDAGVLQDGRLFYVMKLVRGHTLEQHARTLETESAKLGVFERVAETVAFAHARGIVHRDLKPSNVMVGPFGEVLVLDWGVAKILGEAIVAGAGAGAGAGAAVSPTVRDTEAHAAASHAVGPRGPGATTVSTASAVGLAEGAADDRSSRRTTRGATVLEASREPAATAHARRAAAAHADAGVDATEAATTTDATAHGERATRAAARSREAGPVRAVGAESSSVTRVGTLLGTPGFMAPEQRAGDPARIGPATDVYALGALLFWLLAGEVPPDDVARAGRALRERHLPKRLRAIVTHCLEPRPADRYAQAGDLAVDVMRYRGGQAVAAYPERLWDRAGRFFATYRTFILIVVAYLVMRAVVAFLQR